MLRGTVWRTHLTSNTRTIIYVLNVVYARYPSSLRTGPLLFTSCSSISFTLELGACIRQGEGGIPIGRKTTEWCYKANLRETVGWRGGVELKWERGRSDDDDDEGDGGERERDLEG